MGTNAELTAGQLVTGIANALRARDLIAVVDLLGILAVIDPQLASDVYDTLQAGIAAGERAGIPDADDLAARLRGCP